MTLFGCSTAPSPRQVTVRDVTAVCPVAAPILDRGFAVSPPQCASKLGRMQFAEDSKWIDLAEVSARELVWRGNCLGEVQDWILAEKAARMTTQELTQ
jgi:hypothetical protein